MTTDELALVFDVALAEPVGLTPHPQYLPVAERLRERGVLVRCMFDGEAVYFASKSFRRKAAALAAHQLAAAKSARDN